MKQLGLFADSAPQPLPHIDADRRLAERLPEGILLGPSSWTFPGWEGIVYPTGLGKETIIEEGLSWIARYPLFRTVGIDRSHYAPLDEATLARYAAQLPPRFPCVIKAWSAITTLADARTNTPNPAFLDAEVCARMVLSPLAHLFAEHIGALVFQFAPIPARFFPRPEAFAEQIDRFFGALPGGFPYAVEIRNRELMIPAYFQVLARHGVAHVLNLWERMPTVGQQLRIPGVFTAPFVVARLSIPPNNRYEAQKALFMPFNRLAVINEAMRADVVSLSRAAQASGRPVFITANNKVEGCSPLTVRGLCEQIVNS
jgi:uncharacterized protein YecE (DUF72 family)